MHRSPPVRRHVTACGRLLALAAVLVALTTACTNTPSPRLSGSLPRCDQSTELPCRQEGANGLEVIAADASDPGTGVLTVPADVWDQPDDAEQPVICRGPPGGYDC